MLLAANRADWRPSRRRRRRAGPITRRGVRRRAFVEPAMPESFGLTPSTPSPQTCTLAEASADDPLLQQLATVNNVHAKLADGLHGALGLYDVQIDGQSKLMTRHELESLNTCFASASNAPAAPASAPTAAASGPAGATVSFSHAAPTPIAAPTATTAKATTAPAA